MKIINIKFRKTKKVYPFIINEVENYKKGDIITGLDNFDENNNELIFIAGAKYENSQFLTNGGRVLNTVGIGTTPNEAREKAYNLLNKINFNGKYKL